MAVTEFMTEIENGPIESSAITIDMIADDTSVKLFGPVVLADGTVNDLPHAASTTTASDKAVIGVCVRLGRNDPGDGTKLVADVTHIEICIFGICKIKVNDANVSLNDSLVTHTTVGEAAVKAAFAVSATPSQAEIQAIANGVRAVFALALSTVATGADSIVAAFVSIKPYPGAA